MAKSVPNLIPLFEESLSKQESFEPHFLDKDVDGRYLNKKVRAMFKGFKLCWKTQLRTVTPEPYEGLYGQYLIAKLDGDQKLQFPSNPTFYRVKPDAEDEAQRLHQYLDETFVVFRCVKVIAHSNIRTKEIDYV